MPTDEQRRIEYWDRKASDNAYSYHAWAKRPPGDANPHEEPLCDPGYFWRSYRGRQDNYAHVPGRRLADIRNQGRVCRRCRQLAKKAVEVVDAD